jgi:hypothetical protein
MTHDIMSSISAQKSTTDYPRRPDPREYAQNKTGEQLNQTAHRIEDQF